MTVSRLFQSKWVAAALLVIGLGGLAWLAVRLAPSPPESRHTPEAVAVKSDRPAKPVAAVLPAAAGKSATAQAPFHDEPAAHALYKQMMEALRKANSLSFVSHFQDEYKGQVSKYAYRAWLKKPNYFRVEAETIPKKTSGILVGDGRTLWIYWPQGRWRLDSENSAAYEKTRLTSYMKESAPPAAHSIWHKMGSLGVGLPVIELSTFHGYTDCLQDYIDGVRALGPERIGREDCDGIHVSIMKQQRNWYLWLSRRDHLPRKLKTVLRLGHDIITDEEWTSVTLNGEINNKLFVWKPPAGWKQWKWPRSEVKLLKAGTKAPDFELASADGRGRIKLSDYRGQIVWFYIWRAG